MELPTDIVWPLTPYWFAGNEVYAGVRGPLIAIAHAQLDRPHLAPTIESSPDSDFKIDKVTECALSLCVKTYNLSVSSGTPAVDVLSVDYGELFNRSIEDYPRPHNNGVDAVTCWKPSGANPNLIQLHNDFRWADTAEFSFCPVEDYIFDVQEQLKAYSSSPWTWLTENRRWEAPAGYSISGANFIQILQQWFRSNRAKNGRLADETRPGQQRQNREWNCGSVRSLRRRELGLDHFPRDSPGIGDPLPGVDDCGH